MSKFFSEMLSCKLLDFAKPNRKYCMQRVLHNFLKFSALKSNENIMSTGILLLWDQNIELWRCLKSIYFNFLQYFNLKIGAKFLINF